MAKGPQRLGRRWCTGGAFNFTTIYYTLATLAYGPHPLRRPWGRIGVPEFPEGSFGMPKRSQSSLNISYFTFPREDFKGRIILNGTPTLRIMESMRE